MKCRICQQTLDPSQAPDHHLQPSPIQGDICAGCWMFQVEAELFLFRATQHTPMGNWTEGWLKAIIEDPAKYR